MVSRGSDVPNADEQECAMGFCNGTTRCQGVSEEQRRELLGQAMDCNAMSWLGLVCLVRQGSMNERGVCPPYTIVQLEGSLPRSNLRRALAVFLGENPAFAAVGPSQQEWTLGNQLSSEDVELVRDLLSKNSDVFSWSSKDLGQYNGSSFTINLKEEVLVFRNKYRPSAAEL